MVVYIYQIKYGVYQKMEKKKSLVKVTTHGGKMTGIPSISTSCILNARCQKRVKCEKSICYNCYAHSYMSFRKSLKNAMEKNYHILTERLLTKNEIEELNINSSFFRFESFGDLNNDIQLINYINICRYYKNTHFALWTKNVDILLSVFSQKKYRKPKNLSLIVSSPLLNVALPLSFVEKVNKIVHIDAIFTVYNEDYAIKKYININCGAKHCLSCLKCYKCHKETIYINEQLK